MREPRHLLTRARSLRHRASDVGAILWQHLRGRQLGEYKFRRQAVIAPYIVDFACFEPRLIVEADGGQHQDQAVYDSRRTAALEARGYQVLRFWNNEILTELEDVLEQIKLALDEYPHPDPLPEGEGAPGSASGE